MRAERVEVADVVLDTFQTVERRDVKRLLGLYHPDVEFCWPPSLPYGGVSRGAHLTASSGPTWRQTWDPLQPTEAERRMDPRVVAAGVDEVVVLYRQRGVTQTGTRCNQEVLGMYRVKDGKLARAQMFYFDTAELVGFFEEARRPA